MTKDTSGPAVPGGGGVVGGGGGGAAASPAAKAPAAGGLAGQLNAMMGGGGGKVTISYFPRRCFPPFSNEINLGRGFRRYYEKKSRSRCC